VSSRGTTPSGSRDPDRGTGRASKKAARAAAGRDVTRPVVLPNEQVTGRRDG